MASQPGEDNEDVAAEDAQSVVADDMTTTKSAMAAASQKELSVDSIQPLNIYQLKPPLHDKFRPNPIREIIRNTMGETLGGQVYSSTDAKKWTIDIANEINTRVKALKMKRYKHIVQVTMGELKGAGVKSGVRCLWDSETDGYTSDLFMNDTLFCVTVVFAVYLY